LISSGSGGVWVDPVFCGNVVATILAVTIAALTVAVPAHRYTEVAADLLGP
jgi:hypothetical protein